MAWRLVVAGAFIALAGWVAGYVGSDLYLSWSYLFDPRYPGVLAPVSIAFSAGILAASLVSALATVSLAPRRTDLDAPAMKRWRLSAAATHLVAVLAANSWTLLHT